MKSIFIPKYIQQYLHKDHSEANFQKIRAAYANLSKNTEPEVSVVMPAYNQLVGYDLTVSSATGSIALFMFCLVIVVGILAGSYPAFFMSSFSPIQSLKGRLKIGKGGAIFRQVLVVTQFSISVLLIIGTIIIMNQMSYMKNKDLGYEQDHTLMVRIDNGEIYNSRLVFKRQLEANSAVAAVSLMSGEPGGFFDMHSFEAEGQRDVFKSRTEFADFQFVQTLGLKIIAGRDLSPAYPTDSSDAVLINRKAAEELGFTPEQAIGKWIKNTVRDEGKRRITGVVENFNFLSLKETMEPLVISPVQDHRLVMIRLKGGNINAGVELVKKQYAGIAAGYPFEYSFLDQQFEQLYRADLKQQTIMGIFSGLAIFIASLGLFGLASFTTNRRLREIGVRKVLGSTPANIVLLLTKDLLKPVIIATLIAIPVSHSLMTNWLQNFAFKTALSWWIFALAAGITFSIAILTVGFKAIKASMLNPISNLRSD
ncbi:MAG: FtsX-like permease family protein [Sphingobacteriaceae bacterium]|nr:MAG: FtsX-like permease family protein [Sphingobacteriaceae bacterium]